MTEGRREDWVPFSHRYGIAGPSELRRWCAAGGEDFQVERWRGRHGLAMSAFASVEESGVYVAPLFRCTCPGSGLRAQDPPRRCAERATQEDRLCDSCRAHCWAVDDTGGQHRLVHVYGPVTT